MQGEFWCVQEYIWVWECAKEKKFPLGEIFFLEFNKTQPITFPWPRGIHMTNLVEIHLGMQACTEDKQTQTVYFMDIDDQHRMILKEHEVDTCWSGIL